MTQTQESIQTDEHNALAGRNLQVRKLGGPIAATVSPTATVIASAGTVSTRSYGLVRLAPAGNVTGVILQTSLTDGQILTLVNESAFSITFAASGTSNVADGTADAIAANSATAYIWDAAQSLWYRHATSVAASVPAVSSTAAATATSGTITTSGVDTARVSPAAAITGVILQAGTVNGQVVNVVNEATGANSVTFAASGTSNVANGVSTVIAGLTAASFVWDTATSLWYHRV